MRHHFSRLRALHAAAGPLSTPNTSALLEAVGLATGGDLCYARFVFKGGAVRMDDAFAKHCSDAGLAAAARNRCVHARVRACVGQGGGVVKRACARDVLAAFVAACH